MAALPPSLLPPAAPAQGAAPVSRALGAAMEGAGFALPLTVGAVGLVFSHIDAALVAPAVLATLFALAAMQLATARSGRPMVYSARLLEAGTLVGLLDQLVAKLPSWNLGDSAGVRLALVMCICVAASAMLPVFYALRLQRFAALIPRPVFAGFNTALAVTILASQSRLLWHSQVLDGPWFTAVALAGMSVALIVQTWRRRWPPALAGLAVAMLLSLLLRIGGVHDLAVLMDGGLTLSLPVLHLPWDALSRPGVPWLAVVRDLVLAAATLSALMFLNTVVADETASQLDGGALRGPRDWGMRSVVGIGTCLLGALPVGSSWTATRSAMQQSPLTPRTMGAVALLVVAVAASGLPALVPLAGVSALLLHNAWNSFDLPTLRLLSRWSRGAPPGALEREDLVTVATVVAAGVLFNMVVAVLVGVVAGLLLYARRNGRHLARAVQDGREARSRCTRTAWEARALAASAHRIGLVTLEGALFFGAAGRLQSLLRSQCGAGRFVVLDWSRVVSADSTIAHALHRAQDEALVVGARLAVCGLPADSEVGAVLRAVVTCPVFIDADRALEWAENAVLASTPRPNGPAYADGSIDELDEEAESEGHIALLKGVSYAGREALVAVLRWRHLPRGEQVFAQGDRDNAIMMILQGSVDIVLADTPGGLRLARIRQGATLGEMSFLDGSPRTATALAAEDVSVAVLTRADFDRYAEGQPEAAHQVLVNLALELALRLRQTNRVAAALQQG